jgi:hypothetical protein
LVDFHYLEDLAARIKNNRKELALVNEKLAEVSAQAHDLPLKSATESTFARMIGTEYHDKLAALETAREKLAVQRDILNESINNDLASFITEITSSDLIVPLEPRPKMSDGNTVYSYRNGAKFTNVFEILSELLGLSAPLVVKDVMLSDSEVVVKVSDEFEAKKKFINSINQVQRTLSIKKR